MFLQRNLLNGTTSLAEFIDVILVIIQPKISSFHTSVCIKISNSFDPLQIFQLIIAEISEYFGPHCVEQKRLFRAIYATLPVYSLA